MSTNDGQSKMLDYQVITKIIFSSYKAAQTNGGIAWQLDLDGKIYNIIFQIPTLFIIGDTDGHDKLVGKFGSRNSNVKRLCRYCDCSFDDTDNPFIKYSFNTVKEISEKIDKEKEEELRLMSFHCVPNAWCDINFCDYKRGIFGSTPAELMHCFQQGLYEYIIKELFDQKKSNPIQ